MFVGDLGADGFHLVVAGQPVEDFGVDVGDVRCHGFDAVTPVGVGHVCQFGSCAAVTHSGYVACPVLSARVTDRQPQSGAGP